MSPSAPIMWSCLAIFVLAFYSAPLSVDAACSADMMKLLYSVPCSGTGAANVGLRKGDPTNLPIFGLLTVEVAGEEGSANRELPVAWAVNRRGEGHFKHAERLLHREFLDLLPNLPASVAQKARIYTSLQPCKACVLELMDSTIEYTDICFDQWDDFASSDNADISAVYRFEGNEVGADKKVKNTSPVKTIAKGDQLQVSATYGDIKTNLAAKTTPRFGDPKPVVDWKSSWDAFKLTGKDDKATRSFNAQFVDIANIDSQHSTFMTAYSKLPGSKPDKMLFLLSKTVQAVCAAKKDFVIDDKVYPELKAWDTVVDKPDRRSRTRATKQVHTGQTIIRISSTVAELQKMKLAEDALKESPEGTSQTPQSGKKVQKPMQKVVQKPSQKGGSQGTVTPTTTTSGGDQK